MKNIKIENAKRNTVIAFGPDRAQARVRTVKGEPGLYEVIVLGDAGAHREFKKGETVSVGTPDDIKDPKVCDGEGRGVHLDPEFMWWTPTETKAYCRKCAGARNRQITAEKKAGTWVPQGKRFRDEDGGLNEAGKARVAAATAAARAGADREKDRDAMNADQIRRSLASTSIRNPRKGQQEMWNALRVADLLAQWGRTWDEGVTLVPELADITPATWAEYRAAYKRVKHEEEDAA